MNRIEQLRQNALQLNHCRDEFYYKFYKAYEEYSHLGEFERYAEAFFRAFCGALRR